MEETEDPRMEQVNDIRVRLERREYEVDVSKVAAAILERLLGGSYGVLEAPPGP